MVDPAVSGAWQWKPCGTLPATYGAAKAIAYAPLTEEVAAAYADGRVILHSVDPATADRVLSGAGPAATEIAFSPDGKLLAEARGGAVSLRRVEDGQVLAMIDATANDCDTPEQLRFSPDGSRLLGRSAGAICVWRTDSAALVATATEAFGAAALTNSNAVVGRLSTGQLVVEALSLPDLTRTAIPLDLGAAPVVTIVGGLAISPAGDSFVAVVQTATDASLMFALWNGAGTMLATRPFTPDQPLVFSPDGRHVLLSGAVLNTGTGAIERVLEHVVPYNRGSQLPMTLNAGGTRLATVEYAGVDEVPVVYDVVSGHELRVAATLLGSAAHMPTDPLNDMSVSANGQFLATGGGGRDLMVFRIASSFARSAAILARSASGNTRIDLSADGETLLCSGQGWELSRTFTGEVLESSALYRDPAADGCSSTLGSLSPRGTWLVIAPSLILPPGGPVLNIRRTERLSTPGAEVPSARCNGRAGFNADETLMATTGPELYRTSDWRRIWPATITPAGQNTSPFGDVQFLPGRREVLISSCSTSGPLGGGLANCSYALYSTDTGRTIRQLPALTAQKAAVSAEGDWIVSGPTLQHLPTGILRTLELDGKPARLSIFTPNGDIIANMPDNTLVRYCRSDRVP